MSDRENPFARPNAWSSGEAGPAPARPAPAPIPRNSIFAGSAVPIGPAFDRLAPIPAPAVDPRPHPEVRPAGETPPPLRKTAFAAPADIPRRRRRSRLRKHVPLIGALASAAAGFAVMAVVFTRAPAEPPAAPLHRPTRLAVLRTSAPVVPASERPTLRGAVKAALEKARNGRRPTPSQPAPPPAPAAPTPVAAAAPQPAVATPRANPPRFTPPPTPDPDAPIATRAPYG